MIDPILLQNKDVIDKVYEHINLITTMNQKNNNKMFLYFIFIVLISSCYFLNKKKINNLITKLNYNYKKKINVIKETNQIEEQEENADEELSDEELSDFEY